MYSLFVEAEKGVDRWIVESTKF